MESKTSSQLLPFGSQGCSQIFVCHHLGNSSSIPFSGHPRSPIDSMNPYLPRAASANKTDLQCGLWMMTIWCRIDESNLSSICGSRLKTNGVHHHCLCSAQVEMTQMSGPCICHQWTMGEYSPLSDICMCNSGLSSDHLT